MKLYLPMVLALACAVLVVALITMKRSNEAQQQNDAGAIADFSNQLWSSQTQMSVCDGAMILLSNQLDQCQSASLALSNLLMDAQSTIVLDAEQITNLNQQVAAAESKNQTLGQRVMDSTNQIAGLTRQIAVIRTNLDQAKEDYALLENRFRRDVAERVVVERKFNNLSELKAQMEKLKNNPAAEISAGSIFAGLDVEVKSNAFHVISPD